MKKLGAHKIINYKEENYLNHGPFDIVFEAVGKSDLSKNLDILKPEGVLILCSGFASIGMLCKKKKKKIIQGMSLFTIEKHL